MQITKPIVFLDVETTGLSIVDDKIVKLSLIKQEVSGDITNGTRFLNPDIHIPSEVSQIHGITDETVSNSPKFEEIGEYLLSFINDTVLVGYNIKKFDWPILVQHFYKANINIDSSSFDVLDLREVYMTQEPRTLEGAFKYYTGESKEVEDAEAMVQIFAKQNSKYADLTKSVAAVAQDLHDSEFVDIARKFKYGSDAKIRFAFGKYDGKTLNYVENNDPSYFTWLLNADFFTEDTKQIIKSNTSITV